jgi:class 3 adenylate cyclase
MIYFGWPSAHEDDAERGVRAALDMIDAVKTFDSGSGRRLALRIGIHTGPVVAGVIGRTKFAYDLWGDTVNVASRLESLTTPGTIQVSESTYERLRRRYAFSPRNVIPVKGRGELPSYLLLARQDGSKSAADANTAPSSRMFGYAAVPTFASSHRTTPA